MILMNDFKAEPPELKASMAAAVARVADSGHFVLGPEVAGFERDWAARCEVAHGVGVGNGMDAIEIGLRALGIGPGDEVITTAMTAFATVLAILRSGATPVLADIRPETALLDRRSVERCLSPRTRALLLVHLYGQADDLDAWEAFCSSNRIALIEDCAQAHLARFNGRPVGSVGAIGAWSFYPTKNLGALGDGGMLVTQDHDIARKAASLRNYGQTVRYHHAEIGLNSRLDEMQAALLSARLTWLDRFTARRQTVADAYRARIRHALVTPMAAATAPATHVHHLFVVTTPRRDALQQHLQDRGVQTHIHYPIPIHRQAAVPDLQRDPQGLPAAEAHAASCLSLPCHPGLNDADVEVVIDAVNAFAP